MTSQYHVPLVTHCITEIIMIDMLIEVKFHKSMYYSDNNYGHVQLVSFVRI